MKAIYRLFPFPSSSNGKWALFYTFNIEETVRPKGRDELVLRKDFYRTKCRTVGRCWQQHVGIVVTTITSLVLILICSTLLLERLENLGKVDAS